MAPNEYENVGDLTPDELITFLVRQKIITNSGTENILRRWEINGSMFLLYEDEEDYEKLGLKKSLGIALSRLRKKVLANKEGGDVQKGAKFSGRYDSPRPFLEPVDGMVRIKYRQGVMLNVHETGPSSLLEPAREFKRIDSAHFTSKLALAENLVSKAVRFAVSCLNSRCNGIFQAGILDRPHGKVMGIDLDRDDMALLQSYMDAAFTGPDGTKIKGYSPDMRDAVRCCCKPFKFVPVVKSSESAEELFVVEMDIEPSHTICLGKKFYTCEGKDSSERQYFFREGANCQKYVHVAEVSRKCEMADRKREGEEAISQQESQCRHRELLKTLSGGWSSGFPNQRYKYVLVTNGIHDIEHFQWVCNVEFYAIIDFGKTGDCDPVSRHPDSQKLSLYDCFEERFELSPVDHAQLLEMERIGSDDASDFLSANSVGEKVLYIKGGQGQHDTGSSWYQKVGKGIKKLLRFMFDVSHIDSLERVVVIALITSSDRHLEVADVIKDLSQVLPTCFQFSVLCPTFPRHVMQTVSQELEKDLFHGPAWRSQCMDFNWSHLNDLLSTYTVKSSSNFLTIPASDTPVTISDGELLQYKQLGLHIWPFNQIQHVCETTLQSDERDAFISESKAKIKDFLRGKSPEWEIFFFAESASVPFADSVPPGMVERDITKDIISSLKDMIKVERRGIATLEVVHMPGSGATTVGRHVLWKMRETWRCAHIDGKDYINGVEVNSDKLNRTAELILQFRGAFEDEKVVKENCTGLKCPVVLILFDNTSTKMLKYLRRRLEVKCSEQGITYSNVLILLLGLISSYTKEIAIGPDDDEEMMAEDAGWLKGAASRLRSRYHIDQALSVREKDLFATRLKQLSQNWESDLRPEDMISFVIMAENYDDNSEYVKKLVGDVLSAITDKRQRETLLYLAILKYFGDCHLPEKHCLRIAFSIFTEMVPTNGNKQEIHEKQTHRSLSQFDTALSIFVNDKEKRNVKWEDSYCVSYRYFEVSHEPVAFHLWKQLCQNRSLSLIVKEMMSNPALVDENFMREFVQYTLRTLLTRRAVPTKDISKAWKRPPKFSRLIEQVKTVQNRESALALLKFAFETLRSDKNKAYIAQAISRLLVEYENVDDEAKNLILERIKEGQEWAKKGTQLNETNFAIRDTLGQAFKRELRLNCACFSLKKNNHYLPLRAHLKQRHQQADSLVLRDSFHIVRAGKIASDNFKEAERLFNNSKHNTSTNQDEQFGKSVHGLYGQIDVNLLITRMLLESKELSLTRRRDEFLKLLFGDDDAVFDLPGLFPGIDWTSKKWTDCKIFLTALFSSTCACFSKATHDLDYANQNDPSEFYSRKILALKLKEFSTLFDGRPPNWQKNMADPTKSVSEKQAYLRKLLAIARTNSFSALAHCKVESDLETYKDYLNQMVEFGKSDMMAEDKISYLNVAFALHREGIGEPNVTLMKEFCQELVQSNVNFPEAYLFYLMLFWPCSEGSSNDPDDVYDVTSSEHLEMLKGSISALEAAERDQLKGEAHREQRAKPHFFLGSGTREDLSALLPRKPNSLMPFDQMRWIYGTLDAQKNVEIAVRVLSRDGGEQELRRLKVRSASLHHRSRPYVNKVRFKLGFAFSGPLAYDSQARDIKIKKGRT